MKQIIKITLSLLFIVASFSSCVNDKDFDTPQVICDDSFISKIPTTSITSFENTVSTIGSFASENSNDVYFIGYVTSSDLEGNFYKELFIQDKIENPTYAVKLDVDLRGMYAKYPIGSKLYIKLNGLSLYESHGELTIGENLGESVGTIRENVSKTHIFRSCTKENIVAKEVTMSTEINDSLLGEFIIIKNAQFEWPLFNGNNEGFPFANPNDNYDSHRNIVLCTDNTILKLETSSFAKYSDLPMPYYKFNISGILSRDYRDDFYVLKLNTPNDIINITGERCDPGFLECEGNNVGGSVIVFNEDFQSYSNNTTIFPGWTSVNVNGGSRKFRVGTYGGKYVGLGAYGSNENPLESWLVTPAIDLDSTTREELTFDTKVRYFAGNPLSVWVSTDFSGDVTTASWMLVKNFNIAKAPNGEHSDFESSGSIDLSCLDGNVHIAFKYLGSDSGITTTLQLDNIKITGN